MLQSSWQEKVGKWVRYTEGTDGVLGLLSGEARRWSCSDSSSCLASEEDEDRDEEEDDEEDDEDDDDEDDDDDELDKRVLSWPSTVLSATILQGRAAPDPLPSLTTTLTSWGRQHEKQRVKFMTAKATRRLTQKRRIFIDKLNKPTLKDNTTSYSLTLFTCGRPCQLSSFKQWAGELIVLWETAFLLRYGQINVSGFVLSYISIVQISSYYCVVPL